MITAGTMLETSNGSLITGMPTLAIPKDYSFLGGFFCGIKHDSLDNYFFPKHGVLAETNYSFYCNWLGNESPADILTARVIAAKSRRSHIGIIRVEATIDEIFSGATLLRDSTSGGFLRMSGIARHEIISGRHAITSMVYMHQSKSLMGSRVKAYHGMSAEVGYFDGTTVTIQPRKPIAAGSVFIAMETPLGPLFAGYGLSESGSNSPFVAMGQVF